VRLAPVLQEVAARLSGSVRTEALPWAYALRDAVGLARPDVVVSHWDATLEAEALTGVLADGDLIDRLLSAPRLAEIAPTRGTIELVRILTGLYGTEPEVAATVTGPASVAARLAASCPNEALAAEDRVELADVCADALAGLVADYGHAGATRVVVVEHDAEFLAAGDAAEVQAPLVRALAHQRLAGVLVAPEGLDLAAAGYEETAERWDGAGAPPPVALLPAALWSLTPGRFAERWRALSAQAAGSDALLLTDGPLAPDMPLENLQVARGRVVV
jgi:hypothetical protein